MAAFREKVFGWRGLVPDLKHSHECTVRLKATMAATGPDLNNRSRQMLQSVHFILYLNP